jgi:hypothetical protein
MLAAAIGLIIIALFYLYNKYIVRKPDPKKDLETFHSHVSEIRDMINRCNSLAEWWTIDREVDWLEQTWSGRIPPAVMIEQTGKLYKKWFDRRREIDPKYKAA